MINIVYACDSNYNQQLNNSINSILKHCSENVSIFIIHDKPVSFEERKLKLIKKFPNLKRIELFSINKNDIKFPNLKNKHVSEATYYRLFIEELIPFEVDFLLYLDADIICIKNLAEHYKRIVDQLKQSEYVIGCRTEFQLNDSNRIKFESLEMNSISYFNAGVMFINFNKWRKNNIGKKLIEKLNDDDLDLEYWDQDLLNNHFDGNYIEIYEMLNKPLNVKWEMNRNEIWSTSVLLHYQGNCKPWNIKYAFNRLSVHYHNNSIDTLGKYHLLSKNRFFDFFHLVKNLVNIKFRHLKSPGKFYLTAISTLIWKSK